MKLATLALVVALAGCEQVKVHVNCETTAAPAIECTVQQTAGKSEVEVCWDFELTCANGNKVTAPRTCQKVKDGGTVNHSSIGVPAAKRPPEIRSPFHCTSSSTSTTAKPMRWQRTG
jgi:hypothetical protein